MRVDLPITSATAAAAACYDDYSTFFRLVKFPIATRLCVLPANDPIKREEKRAFFSSSVYIKASWQCSVVMETPNQAWVARVQLRCVLSLCQ